MLDDIRYWMAKVPECSLAFEYREKNQAPDCLAKRARQHPCYQYFNVCMHG